jgi:hypothetical protein
MERERTFHRAAFHGTQYGTRYGTQTIRRAKKGSKKASQQKRKTPEFFSPALPQMPFRDQSARDSASKKCVT